MAPLLVLLLALTGCGGSSSEGAPATAAAEVSTAPPVPEPSTTASTTAVATAATAAPTTTMPPTTLATTAPSAPTVELDIASVTDDVLIDRSRRTAVDGADTYYWPDGNVGGVDLGDGQVTYFAANGPVTARTVGGPSNPAERLLDAAIVVDGVDEQFDYAAGGPVHFDAPSGTLLLWYHAERHLDGPALFHAAIGLARSTDGGSSFTDLGIIIETNSPPSAAAPCCADVGGAPVIQRDGMFHVYFRDRIGPTGSTDIQLARASAPVDEVLDAATRGETSQWLKYANGDKTAGLGGRPSALEDGNPRTNWFDIAWHERLGVYLLVIAEHGGLTDPSTIWLTTSSDGVTWSARQQLTTCDCELTYPSFLDVLGTEREVGDQLTISYVATDADAAFRWERTDLRRLSVKLT